MSEAIDVSNQNQSHVRRTIFKNIIAVTLGNMALRVVNFLFSVYVVRQLGDDRYGQYSIVMGFVFLLTIVAELGVTQYVTREIARDRSKAHSLLSNLMALRMLLALQGIVIITVGAVIMGYTPELIIGVFLLTLGFLLSAIEAPLTAVLTANERLDYTSAFAVVGQLTFLASAVLFLRAGWGFIALIVASHVSILPRLALAVWVIKRNHLTFFSWRLDPHLWPKMIRSGIAFGMIQLALTIGFSLDEVIMSRFLPAYMVGWYALASTLAATPMILVQGLRESIVPTLSWAYVREPEEVQRWYYRTVKVIVVLSLPSVVGGMIVAFRLFQLLYTREFLPAAFVFQILIWDLPLIMFMAFGGNMTTIVDEEKSAARIYGFNAVANLILNLYAIPRFGIVGAALVTVLTDFVSVLQFYHLLRRKLRLPAVTSILVRVLIASLLMGLALSLVGHLNLFILIALGAIIYAALLLAFRLVDSSEWALIMRWVNRVRGYLPVR